DGSSLQRIPNLLKDWFFRNTEKQYLPRVLGRYDQPNSLAIFAFSSLEATPPGTLDTQLIFNTRAQKWTKAVPRTPDGAPLVIGDVVLPSFVVDTGLTYDD